MPPRDNQAALLDILQAAQDIADFIDGMVMEDFLRDKKTQAAVQHQIMIIGEAAKHLSPLFCEKNAHIPWGVIARMRDRLIHGYFTVDLHVVWDTASESIPMLRKAIAPLAKN